MRAPDSDRTFQPDSRGQIRHAAAGSGGGSHSEPGLAADLRCPIEQRRRSSVPPYVERGRVHIHISLRASPEGSVRRFYPVNTWRAAETGTPSVAHRPSKELQWQGMEREVKLTLPSDSLFRSKASMKPCSANARCPRWRSMSCSRKRAVTTRVHTTYLVPS